MESFISTVRHYFALWFHQRNIIIVSAHKVKHIAVSGKLQLLMVSVLVAGICWASYSTGSFLAARDTLKEQRQTLRSLATARVETNFHPLFPVTQPTSDETITEPAEKPTPLGGPSFTLSSLGNLKLYARVAYLEKQVTDLQNANETIIQRVRDKTSGHIDDLESIIRHTGLSVDALKKDVSDNKSHSKHADAEGGPYIPLDTNDASAAREMFSDLDELKVLQQIVSNLPLGAPLDGEEESPFGRRIDPFTGRLAFDSGLDISGPAGSKIYSTADGKVSNAGRNGEYGNSVDIDHGFGLKTRYGHMSEILVHEGDVVHKGDVIGIQGSTGRSTGAHVHYEVRYHDQPMNPKQFVEAEHYVSQN